MRHSGVDEADLQKGLARAGEACAESSATEFAQSTEGELRALRADVTQEVLNIGREAIRNAFAHSHASQVSMHVCYEPDGFRLVINDDGDGIPDGVLEAGGKNGHWGIVGMKERAKRMASSLTIRSARSKGSELELQVPARVIYVEGRGRLVRAVAFIRSRLGLKQGA